MAVKIAFLVAYIVMTVAIGVVSMKKVTGVNSFLLGGRNMGAWLVAWVMLAKRTRVMTHQL